MRQRSIKGTTKNALAKLDFPLARNKQARDKDDDEETVERKIMEVLPLRSYNYPFFRMFLLRKSNSYEGWIVNWERTLKDTKTLYQNPEVG